MGWVTFTAPSLLYVHEIACSLSCVFSRSLLAFNVLSVHFVIFIHNSFFAVIVLSFHCLFIQCRVCSLSWLPVIVVSVHCRACCLFKSFVITSVFGVMAVQYKISLFYLSILIIYCLILYFLFIVISVVVLFSLFSTMYVSLPSLFIFLVFTILILSVHCSCCLKVKPRRFPFLRPGIKYWRSPFFIPNLRL